LQERAVRLEEELKGQRSLIREHLHQFDKRFNVLTWVLEAGFTLTISILVVVLNFVLKCNNPSVSFPCWTLIISIAVVL
jgi:hypothetical protein